MYTKKDIGKKIVASYTTGATRLVLFEYTITRVSLDGTYVMAKQGNLDPVELKATNTAHDKATLIELINRFKQDSDYLDTSVTSDSFTVDRLSRNVDKYGDAHLWNKYSSYTFSDGMSPAYTCPSLYDDVEKLAKRIMDLVISGIFFKEFMAELNPLNFTEDNLFKPLANSVNFFTPGLLA